MNFNELTDNQRQSLATAYHANLRELDTLIDELYADIHRLVCHEKGVFVTPCNYVTLTAEDNILNGIHTENDKGICLGGYVRENKSVYVNLEGMVRMVIRHNGRCHLKTTALIMVNTIAHEITHYLQHANGEAFDMITAYEDRHHEVEARAISERVTIQLRALTIEAVKRAKAQAA